MSTQVFTEIPFNGYSYKDELPVGTIYVGPYETQRVLLSDISVRHYAFPLSRKSDERQTIDAFLVRGRQLQYENFYVQDPLDDGISNVSIGTGTGSAVTFSLPITGENRRFYPISTGLVVKVSGTPVTVSSVSTDARTVTLASPPAGAAPVTVTCDVYRRVRLDELAWDQLHANWFSAVITMTEVLQELA